MKELTDKLENRDEFTLNFSYMLEVLRGQLEKPRYHIYNEFLT
jgi:hypothetical protein